MATTAKPAPIATSRSTSPPSFLPLPRALRNNRSFAQLTRLLGISSPQEGSDSGSEDEDDYDDETRTLSNSGDDDGDAQSDVDEESLMWDAQTALIAHQPALAAKYYATAGLPPYCSPAACLALGNLLARGSGLSQSDNDTSYPRRPSDPTSSPIARSPQVSWFGSLFRTVSPPPMSPMTPTVERRPSFVSNGWSLPTDGKRVVRDVEGMGKAGGWLVLGIGWILDAEAAAHPYPVKKIAIENSKIANDEDSDDTVDAIVISKGKGRARPVSHHVPVASTSSSDDSFDVPTPEEGEVSVRTDGAKIKLLYNLITPLLHMYRHGHIQQHDPVALPPLASSQLPRVLRPQGDNQKGRNVWSLGSTVVIKVLELPLVTASGLNKEESMKRDGIVIVCNYIRGITSSPHVAEASFKTILQHGPSGLDVVDDLLRQSYRRLNLILKTTGGSPVTPSVLEAFPFPLVPLNSNRSLGSRKRSTTSLLSLADSVMSSTLRLMPVKSTASLASLSCDPSTVEPLNGLAGTATRTLRDIQRHQRKMIIQQHVAASNASSRTWWPSLQGWNMTTTGSPLAPVQQEREPERETEPPKNRPPTRRKERPTTPTPTTNYSKVAKESAIRAVASSPQLDTHRRRLPFEPTEAVASIDPELAALELASALTKHVTCSICNAAGVNFPNCRKCGLTFCSRKCRVDENGAGNGKKHICGAWAARQLHGKPQVIAVTPIAPLSKVH